jgi:putative DNA primase/helicase
VEQMARADQRLVLTIDELDADPWILNTPAGVVDPQPATYGRIHPTTN